ncbi:MAG: hypothetical protein AAGA93_03785, partial [Actinomycetota bacterium]
YLLITGPRVDRIDEATWILDNLERRDRRADALVVNRVLPFASADGPDDAELDGLAEPLAVNLRQLRTMADQEQAIVGPLVDRVRGDRTADEVPVVQVPEQLVPVHDLDGLRELARSLDSLASPLADAGTGR